MDGRLTARLVVLIGALFGLFAMHGLGDHGAAPHEMHAAAMAPVIAAADPPHGAHAAHASHTGASDELPAKPSAAAPDSPGSGMWMAGLCLAVLVGALIGFLLARPQRVAVFNRSNALAFVPARPSGRRDRDPPCLFALSVLRT